MVLAISTDLLENGPCARFEFGIVDAFLNALQACDLIKSSWNEVLKSANATGHHFGYFVFQRVFQKDPSLKSTFGLKHDDEISEIPDDHECIRHTKIFTNIIHLAAKNVDELEPQVAPAIFKYGERHYNTKASDRMTEENVRMVCAQVVCTVCDLLGDDAHPKIVEAWIEMMSSILDMQIVQKLPKHNRMRKANQQV
ncbi:globin [Teladorsagia circumcincta]|uniref:Globin n=1 Tax=Teladorsagia circumcincta TaxID=45464 RepID=A0A2G9UCP9_TELCI|nr:globin [Teladorsagia circumcincta]